MANKVPVSIVLTAVDKATAKFASINAKLSRLTQPAQKYSQAFSNLSNEIGFNKVGASFSEVGKSGSELFGALFGAATKAAFAITAAAGSAFALTKNFADAGDHVSMMSARLGMSTKAYQELTYAASRADVSSEEFDATMQKLSKGIAETAAGTGEAMIGFNALGVNIRNKNGHLKTTEEILPEIADKLGGLKDQNLRNALAMKIFGREGAKLNGIFKEGSAGLNKLRQEAQDVGAVMTPEQIKAAEDFDDGLKSIFATFKMVRNIIGAELSPVIIDLGKQLQKWVLDHKDKISSLAKQFASEIPKAIEKSIQFFNGLKTSAAPVVNFLSSLIDRFGAVNVALAAMGAWIAGPVVVSFIKFASAIAGTIGPMSSLIYRIGSFALGPIILGVQNLWIALQAGYPILTALRLAFAANPIGLAITGVVALSTAVYALWKNWDSVLSTVSKAWDTFKQFLGFGSKNVSVNQKQTLENINPALIQGPMPQSFALGEPVGAKQVQLEAAKGSVSKTENQISVSFDNMPKGTRVEIQKAEIPIDIFNGVATAGSN